MELISDKIHKIIIKKKKEDDKKYILNKVNDENIIGIIPFFWQKPKIYNEGKKLFLSPSNLFLENNKIDYITFRNKNENETLISYKKNIKKEIISYFEKKMGYEGLKMKNIINILDINSNKTKVYVIYLNSNKNIFNKIKKEYDNFKNMSLLLYFDNPKIKDNELLNNIIETKQNEVILNRMISLYENEEKILDIRLKTLYNKILNH